MESKLADCSYDEVHSAIIIKKYMYCGNKKYQRKFCPEKEVICFYCSKKGNFSKVSQKTQKMELLKDEMFHCCWDLKLIVTI